MTDELIFAEPEMFPYWKRAVKKLIDGGLTYGSTVTRQQIAELCNVEPAKSIIDVRRYDLDLLRNTSAIKDALLTSHSMLLVSDGAGGYLVIAPKEQTQHAISSGTRAIVRELQRMATGVTFIRTDMLTDEERSKNADAQAKLSSLSGMLSKHEIMQIANG